MNVYYVKTRLKTVSFKFKSWQKASVFVEASMMDAGGLNMTFTTTFLVSALTYLLSPISVCLCISVSVCLCMSLCMSVYICLCMSVYVCVCLTVGDRRGRQLSGNRCGYFSSNVKRRRRQLSV